MNNGVPHKRSLSDIFPPAAPMLAAALALWQHRLQGSTLVLCDRKVEMILAGHVYILHDRSECVPDALIMHANVPPQAERHQATGMNS